MNKQEKKYILLFEIDRILSFLEWRNLVKGTTIPKPRVVLVHSVHLHTTFFTIEVYKRL
jgi:hypothetical protein